jgi:hypothetical protein
MPRFYRTRAPHDRCPGRRRTHIPSMRRLRLLALLAALPACSTALSTMQPADTLPPGDWHIGGGVSVDLPVTRIGAALDQAYTVGDKYRQNSEYRPSAEEQRQVFDAAVGLALNAPGVTYDLMVRYGVYDRIDLGVRWTTTGLHFDAKFQFLRDAGWDGSISVGYGWHFFDSIIFGVLDFLRIADYSRHDLEVPVIFGRRFGRWGYVWGGPKYVMARYSIASFLPNVTEPFASSGFIHYIGGFAGFAAGYRWVFVFAELTVMDMIAKPVILGQPTDIGGAIVVPSLGVMARF